MDEFRAPDRTDAAEDGAHPALHDLVEEVLADAAALEDRLDSCDAYVVLVVDPATGALDSYGPFDGPSALLDAERRRREFDGDALDDVDVAVVRHHRPDGHHALAS